MGQKFVKVGDAKISGTKVLNPS